MRRRPNLLGQRFGRLVVVGPIDGPGKWVCLCDCGQRTRVSTASLRSGGTISCGCRRNEPRNDLAGKTFGRLTVVELAARRNGRPRWVCRCECGAACEVVTHSLTSGLTRSCGCLRLDSPKRCTGSDGQPKYVGERYGKLTVLSTERRRKSGESRFFAVCVCDCGNTHGAWVNSLRTGHSTSCGCAQHVPKHGGSRTAEYRILMKVVQRCTNPSDPGFDSYGGRGITVCDRWRESFESFLADMGTRPTPRHSIDRIDNDRGYEPGNCRWALPLTQSRNRRARSDSKSGFRGIGDRSGRWVAYIVTNGKRTELGSHGSLESALAARLAAEERYWCGVHPSE